MRFGKFALAVIMMATGSLTAASADEFPSRPVRIVVPYTAGGATDTLARTFADKLSQILGYRAFVENKPGASGELAAKMVSDSEDGHTLLFSDSSIFVIVPHIKAQKPWKFAPVAVIARQTPVLAVRKSLPASNVKELLQIAREQPDKITYGSFGIGTWSHVAMEGLQQQSQSKLLHVPYRGTAQVITDALGERIDVLMNTAGAVSQYLPSGELRLLAVGTKKRSPEFPDVPTIAETVPGFSIDVWFGLVAPNGMSRAALDRLQVAIRKIQEDETFRTALRQQSLEPGTEMGGEFGTFMAAEFDRWGSIVEKAGIRE